MRSERPPDGSLIDRAGFRHSLSRYAGGAAITTIGLIGIGAGTVAAQPSASEIIGAFCDNALFSALIDVAFALMFIFLAVMGLLQLTAAAKDANNPNKKGEGEEKAKNGGTTLLGAALVPTMYILLGLFLPDCFALTGAGISALSGGSGVIVTPITVKAAVLTLLLPVNVSLVNYGRPKHTGETDSNSINSTTTDERE